VLSSTPPKREWPGLVVRTVSLALADVLGSERVSQQCKAWYRAGGCILAKRHEGPHRNQTQLDEEALRVQVHDLQNEVAYLKASQWEPAEGIWRVERNDYGRSSTLVAKPDVAEREAILRAVLQQHVDVAVKAIRGVYDREKFCPTMLEHEDHDGYCGVWPSADAIWSAIRDGLAKGLEDE
jgi:hypothetical protein